MTNRMHNWSHLLALVIGVLASVWILEFLAVDRCLDHGGRVIAWSCDTASGTVEHLINQLNAGLVAIAVLLVGLPAYLAIMGVAHFFTKTDDDG